VSETDALRSLMEADRWVERVSAQRNHLPEMAELSTLESELRGLLGALREAEAALAPIRTAFEDAEKEAERLRRRAGDLEKTLAASTANARELAALQHEVEHVRELLGRSEDRELEFLVALEPLEDEVAAIKARAQPGMGRRVELQAIIKDLQDSLDEELVALRATRAEKAAVLSGELLARYDYAFARVGGSGAALVNAGRCDGCRIALSPLDLSRYKAQPAGEFMTCAECGRLLVP
jgi:predicted  nucleic acid-binding Zn-ribbon protein